MICFFIIWNNTHFPLVLYCANVLCEMWLTWVKLLPLWLGWICGFSTQTLVIGPSFLRCRLFTTCLNYFILSHHINESEVYCVIQFIPLHCALLAISGVYGLLYTDRVRAHPFWTSLLSLASSGTQMCKEKTTQNSHLSILLRQWKKPWRCWLIQDVCGQSGVLIHLLMFIINQTSPPPQPKHPCCQRIGPKTFGRSVRSPTFEAQHDDISTWWTDVWPRIFPPTRWPPHHSLSSPEI